MHERPEIPAGWNYDFVNSDIVTNVLEVRGGALVTATGMKYKALRIDPEVKYMSLPVLRAIAGFARSGVHVFGPKPGHRADLGTAEDGDKEFAALADEIWALPNVHGDIFDMNLTGVGPDVALADGSALSDSVKFVHRHLRGAEIYWIANNSASPRDLDISLRCRAGAAEIWHPDTGMRESASMRREGERSVVHLSLTRDDAQFVLLYRHRKGSGAGARQTSASSGPGRTIDGPWTVSFSSAVSTPGDTTIMSDGSGLLRTLDTSGDEDIRYFSGTACYKTTFNFEGGKDGRHVMLDLGEVYNMARVLLNGKDMGLLWKEPFRTDITDALVIGENSLELRVTDSWANRLIGDEVRPEGRSTYTVIPYYDASSPLLVSGLRGPVRIF